MTKQQKQIARIEKMEAALDEILAAEEMAALALDRLESLPGQIKALSGYLGSEDWRRDYQDDEDGRLPADLKRGVLSQDGAYNALEEYREIMARMLGMVSKHIEKGAL